MCSTGNTAWPQFASFVLVVVGLPLPEHKLLEGRNFTVLCSVLILVGGPVTPSSVGGKILQDPPVPVQTPSVLRGRVWPHLAHWSTLLAVTSLGYKPMHVHLYECVQMHRGFQRAMCEHTYPYTHIYHTCAVRHTHTAVRPQRHNHTHMFTDTNTCIYSIATMTCLGHDIWS